MAHVVAIIKSRQENSGMSVERYANSMGITTGALYNYFNQNRSEISTSSLQKMGRFFAHQGDDEVLTALASYALGVDVEVKAA